MLTGVCAEAFGILSNDDSVILPTNATILYKLKQVDPNIKTAYIYQNIVGMNHFLGYGTTQQTQPYQNARPYIDLPLWYIDSTTITTVFQIKLGTFFVFFYMKIPDLAGHIYGENSKIYSNAIIEADRVLGVALASYPNARIYVTTDHGFKEGGWGHQNQPDIWIGTNDPLINIHYQVEITPYILSLFR